MPLHLKAKLPSLPKQRNIKMDINTLPQNVNSDNTAHTTSTDLITDVADTSSDAACSWTVYILRLSNNGLYLGLAKNLKSRRNHHLISLRKGRHSSLQEHWDALPEDSRHLNELEEVATFALESEAALVESHLIRRYKGMGLSILNKDVVRGESARAAATKAREARRGPDDHPCFVPAPCWAQHQTTGELLTFNSRTELAEHFDVSVQHAGNILNQGIQYGPKSRSNFSNWKLHDGSYTNHLLMKYFSTTWDELMFGGAA